VKNNNEKGSNASMLLAGEPGTVRLADLSGESCLESFEELGYIGPQDAPVTEQLKKRTL